VRAARRRGRISTAARAGIARESGVVLDVMFGVVLGSLLAVMAGMQAVGVRHMRMVAGLLMIAGLVMLGRLTMMKRRILVVLGRGLVVIAALVCRAHVAFLRAWNCAADTARLH
jgi:hypothetical protein